MALTTDSRRHRDDEQPSSPSSSSEEGLSATSSNKENHNRRLQKRKSDHAMSSSAHNASSSGSKRRRLAELQANAEPTQSSQFRSQRPVTDFYDPDQDVGERREIRKSLRDLNRDLQGKTVLFQVGYVAAAYMEVQISKMIIFRLETRVSSTPSRKRTTFSAA
jgi:hypothetical protein